jgi:CheY-like chemotaxis protein
MKQVATLDCSEGNFEDRAPGHHFQPKGSFGFMAENLAHGLNNVFAPIMTSMEVLQLRTSDEPSRELLNLIQRQARQGSYLVQQILSFANGAESTHTCIQPQSLLRALEKFLAKNFPGNIKINFHVAANLWEVLGALFDIYQVLIDLCINASKRMPKGGTLTVTAENVLVADEYLFRGPAPENARYVLFTIKDTGVGLSEALQEQIFSAAYARKAKAATEGLGLFAADMVIKAHGGQIKVVSEADRGSTFKVYLPAAPGSAPDVSTEKGVPHGHQEWILVVDDEEAILSVTRLILETAGYQVITAVNGADAMSAYLQYGKEIALVLMDINMPYVDGAVAIRALRKMNPFVKTIAISGLNTQIQAARAAKAGASGFVPKPFRSYDLLRSIHDLLRSDMAPAQ